VCLVVTDGRGTVVDAAVFVAHASRCVNCRTTWMSVLIFSWLCARLAASPPRQLYDVQCALCRRRSLTVGPATVFAAASCPRTKSPARGDDFCSLFRVRGPESALGQVAVDDTSSAPGVEQRHPFESLAGEHGARAMCRAGCNHEVPSLGVPSALTLVLRSIAVLLPPQFFDACLLSLFPNHLLTACFALETRRSFVSWPADRPIDPFNQSMLAAGCRLTLREDHLDAAVCIACAGHARMPCGRAARRPLHGGGSVEPGGSSGPPVCWWRRGTALRRGDTPRAR